ncbi:MAG TPA: hypothetical protein DCW72_00550, partial [Elusimicrobia bacterium]|nr:hypothetical protein [Elusimicrobiota bacterium]
ALNYLFIKTVTPPVAGIALSTSVMYAVSFGLLYYILGKRLGGLPGRYIAKGLGGVAAIALVMGVFAHFAYAFAERLWPPVSVLGRACLLAGPILLSLLLLAGLARFFKFDEYDSLIVMLKEKAAPFFGAPAAPRPGAPV